MLAPLAGRIHDDAPQRTQFRRAAANFFGTSMTPATFIRYEDLSPAELRARLLGFARQFVERARTLSGVHGIAMIGSLLTEKEDPKDVDLLVTVDDACDLAPLAQLGRSLQGKAQALNHGADIFLAAPDGRYLGRTCHWRECRPGLRVACDALHCGRRHFLHDDLESVTLPPDLVRQPPLELHPQCVVRIALPRDVTEWLASMGALSDREHQ